MTGTNVVMKGSAGRSVGAVVAGLVAVFALSLGTDQLFHALDVYPPWGEPMFEAGLLALATSYRLVFNVAGSWLTARLAPRNPMKHALILGGIGVVLSGLGAVGAAMMEPRLGPMWYPVLLVITALPCSWLGGWLFVRRRPA